MSTPYMALTLPVPTQTPGPLYAFELDQAFTVVDAHNHSPGSGAPVLTAGININADLAFNSYNATLLRSSRYVNNSSPLSLPADICSVYVAGGDMYYNNSIGQQIQITAGGALNAASIGGIGGDYSTSTASVFYTSAQSTFTFWQAPNTPAYLDVGPITIRNPTLSSFGILLSPPPGLSADYGLQLPSGLPASTKIVTLDSAGNLAAVYDVDNSTIEVVSNTIQVKDLGITDAKIANNTITPDKLVAGAGIVPTGAMLIFGGTTVPSGYLMCDGSSQLIASYPALAAVLFDSSTGNYAYGSLDGTHFTLPNLTSGVFLRGTDTNGNYDPDRNSRSAANPGGNTGNNVGSFQAWATETHVHTIQSFTEAGGGGAANFSGAVTSPGSSNTFAGNGNSGNATSETRPTNVYVNYIIKT